MVVVFGYRVMVNFHPPQQITKQRGKKERRKGGGGGAKGKGGEGEGSLVPVATQNQSDDGWLNQFNVPCHQRYTATTTVIVH